MKKFGTIKFILFSIFFISPLFALAQHEECDCPEHPGKVNKKIIESFDLIFRGSVKEIHTCENQKQKVIFQGLELFRNDLTPWEISLEVNCNQACAFQFNTGEEWLIYAHEDSTQKSVWTAQVCERSRKVPKSKQDDAYTLYNDMSFQEELSHLRLNVHPKPLFIDNKDLEIVYQDELKVIDANRDITTKDVPTKLILLGVSFLTVILILWISRRIFKNK